MANPPNQKPADPPSSASPSKPIPPESTSAKVDPRARFRAKAEAPSGGIANAKSGFAYTFLQTTTFKSPLEQAAKEAGLLEDGWEVATDGEFVPGLGDAVVWRRAQDLHDAEWLSGLADCVCNELWAALYFARKNNWLPPEVEVAMSFFHGEKKPPAGVTRPTREQLVGLVWDYVKPHPTPGKQAPKRYAWMPTPRSK